MVIIYCYGSQNIKVKHVDHLSRGNGKSYSEFSSKFNPYMPPNFLIFTFYKPILFLILSVEQKGEKKFGSKENDLKQGIEACRTLSIKILFALTSQNLLKNFNGKLLPRYNKLRIL